MKNEKSQSFLGRKLFDLQEAVVLLDVYLTEVKQGSSFTKVQNQRELQARLFLLKQLIFIKTIAFAIMNC